MRETLSGASERRVCRLLGVSRSSVRPRTEPERRAVPIDGLLAARIHRLIRLHPTFGYRRIWALLRFRQGIRINRKAVYRVLKLKGWFVHQRRVTPRPRARGWPSRTARSDEQWAMDVTHIPCGRDGWAHLVAVIDCHDREVAGYESPFEAAHERPSARWKKPASAGSERFVLQALRRSSAATTA